MARTALGLAFVTLLVLGHCSDVSQTISTFAQPDSVRAMINSVPEGEMKAFKDVLDRMVAKVKDDPMAIANASPQLLPVLAQFQQVNTLADQIVQAMPSAAKGQDATTATAVAAGSTTNQAITPQLEQRLGSLVQSQAGSPPAPAEASALPANGDKQLFSAFPQLRDATDGVNKARMCAWFIAAIVQLSVECKILIADYKETVRGMSEAQAHMMFRHKKERIMYLLKGASDSSGLLGVLVNMSVTFSFVMFDLLGPNDTSMTRQLIGLTFGVIAAVYQIYKLIALMDTSQKELSNTSKLFIALVVIGGILAIVGFAYGVGADQTTWVWILWSFAGIMIFAHAFIVYKRIVTPTVDQIRGGGGAATGEYEFIGITRLFPDHNHKLFTAFMGESAVMHARSGEKLMFSATCAHTCPEIEVKITRAGAGEALVTKTTHSNAHPVELATDLLADEYDVKVTSTQNEKEVVQEGKLMVHESLFLKPYHSITVNGEALEDKEYSGELVVVAKCRDNEARPSCSGFSIQGGANPVSSAVEGGTHKATFPAGATAELTILRKQPAGMNPEEKKVFSELTATYVATKIDYKGVPPPLPKITGVRVSTVGDWTDVAGPGVTKIANPPQDPYKLHLRVEELGDAKVMKGASELTGPNYEFDKDEDRVEISVTHGGHSELYAFEE